MNTRTFVIALVFALLLGAWYVHVARADVNQHGNAYEVTLICPHLAEDSAGNVRLVTYEHSDAPGTNTVIVYRCKRFGY
jgi:hypothetical protein